jgi:hypothetical protein
MYVEKQIGDNADGTIGYDVFENKILEIDFTRSVMIVRDRNPNVASYTPFPMILDGKEVPSIAATLVAEGSLIPRPLLFDMGATGCVFLNYETAKENHLFENLQMAGSGNRTGAGAGAQKTALAILPELRLGPYVLKNVPINMALRASNEKTEELGMDVITRFNLVLNFPRSVIYMKPNGLFDAPYRQRSLSSQAE